ncbi:hypothetical protein KY385_02505 [Candidatus Parcubacteria bacterium]|nr:hypothetical protein [Candidatus Parcubacteria bacterium]
MAVTKKNTNAKTTVKKPRTKKRPVHKSFRLSKPIKQPLGKPLPGIYRLFKQTLRLLLNNKKLFFGIITVYILLSLILVSGLSSFTDFFETKQKLDEGLAGEVSGLGASLTLLGVLLSSGGNAGSEAGGVYQLFITLIASLALIWAIRQVSAGEKVGVKQAFYRGLYPFTQFVLVACVIVLQLIPFLIGNFLLTTAMAGSIAITPIEKSFFIILFLLLSLLSLYMVLSSVFALYIVTLPDMTPVKALRSARDLVLHRRFSVALRLLGLPVLSFLFFVILVLPLIYFLPFLAVLVFLILSGLMLYFFHAYTYNLYRALL